MICYGQSALAAFSQATQASKKGRGERLATVAHHTWVRDLLEMLFLHTENIELGSNFGFLVTGESCAGSCAVQYSTAQNSTVQYVLSGRMVRRN